MQIVLLLNLLLIIQVKKYKNYENILKNIFKKLIAMPVKNVL